MLRETGGKHDRSVSHGDNAVGRLTAAGDDGVDGLLFVMEPDRDGLIPPRVIDLITAIAREYQADPKFRCGIAERSDLVSGRRRNQQNALQTISIGSAQQYHGSLT
jgi:hypothetical protein